MELSVLAAGLLTTFVLIVAGAVLRTRLRFRDTFWEDLERLAYWVLLPALLVRGLAGADFTGIAVDRAAAVMVGSALVAALLAWISDMPSLSVLPAALGILGVYWCVRGRPAPAIPALPPLVSAA